MIKTCFAFFILMFAVAAQAEPLILMNVSYDPTREFYEQYNKSFVEYWKNTSGTEMKIVQSHGGSGKQARSVIEGLKADVVTLALATDIDAIAEKTGLIPPDWQKKFPENSSPFHSTIVFLVRKNNPKHIKDWDDLVRDNVQILTPNPKTSGGARWNYLAAWGYAYKKNNNNEEAAQNFIKQFYGHAALLDTGARAATTNFVKRNIADVLVTWENEALYITHNLDKDEFEIVYPSISILAEPPVAVVEKNAEKGGKSKEAFAYLNYLYAPASQDLGAKFYYRPTDKEVLKNYASVFPAITLFTADELGGLKALSEKHFADGGVFDHIYTK